MARADQSPYPYPGFEEFGGYSDNLGAVAPGEGVDAAGYTKEYYQSLTPEQWDEVCAHALGLYYRNKG